MEMKTLVEKFPEQLREALKIGNAAQLAPAPRKVANVLITGLGGSGIGGTIISELAFSHCPVPVQVTKGYFIPDYVGPETLVIVSSYSGNTEETLECMDKAMAKGAMIACVTSGGKVAEKAKAAGLNAIIIPGGMPPRSCLGYSLTQLVFIFKHFGLLGAEHISNLEKAANLLNTQQSEILALSKKAAQFLNGKTPVIYSTTLFEGVAVRFRQQLNENAKILCWHHVIPEMNHNELVGWAGGNEDYAVVLFRDSNEYERNDFRIQINKDIITRYTPHFMEIFTKGESYLEKALYLIHVGDWISVDLADLRGVDAVEVNVINFLKGELGKK